MLIIIIRSLFLVLKIILGFKEDSNSIVYKSDIFVINFCFLNCNERAF